MATPLVENEILGHLAVLEKAIQQCKIVLRQRGIQEADLRDSLSLLKFAHADTERALLGSERPDWLDLSSVTINTVSTMLDSLRNFNPQLSNWEKARDPQLLVQDLGLRSSRR